jgi:hypothetical protein
MTRQPFAPHFHRASAPLPRPAVACRAGLASHLAALPAALAGAAKDAGRNTYRVLSGNAAMAQEESA